MQTRNNLYFNDHATINALGISTTIPSDRLLSMHSTGANIITVCFNDMDNDGDDNDHVALTLTNESTNLLDSATRRRIMNVMASLANTISRDGFTNVTDTLNGIHADAEILSSAITKS